MKVVSLFTGAGGFDLGLQQAGHEIILQCEVDAGAQQVLRRQFPGTLLVSDICGLSCLPKGTELVVAGFPCIDLSRAGKRAGLGGQSTVLVRHVFRLLEKAAADHRAVPWVLLENVEALLDRSGGEPPMIEYITSTLQQLGYSSWAHRVINTAGFGVPHARRRVFVVASFHGDARDVLLSQGAGMCCRSCLELFDNRACSACHDPQDSDVSYAIDLGNAQSRPTLDLLPTLKTTNDRICLLLSTGQCGMLRLDDAERAQGFPEGWTKACYPVVPQGLPPHKLPPTTDATASRREAERWTLVGNAVSVAVAKWLGERLKAPHRYKYNAGSQDQVFPIELPARPERWQPHLASERAFQAEWDWDMEGGAELYAFSMRHKTGLLAERRDHAGCEVQNDSDADLNEDEFQQLITNEESRKKLMEADTGFQKRGKISEAWPNAAWYIRGLGRFRILHMSDAPVLTPLTRLAEFISKVGEPPSQESLQIYLHRLREHGFDVSPTLRKALQCGAQIQQEVREVVRLKGGLQDADTIGPLVWARSPNSAGVWWPAEVLDPFFMPLTRILPPGATLALSKGEYRASIPSTKGGCVLPEDWLAELHKQDLGLPAVAAEMRESGHKAPVEGEASGQRLLRNKQTGQSGRKVLVVFLGDRFSVWQQPAELLPYKRHQQEKEVVASELAAANKLAKPHLFQKALQEVRELLELREGKACASALAAHAASRAAAINLHPRCQSCEACLRVNMSNRRCLYIRAAAAAAAGHSGAQLAVLGQSAIGARLKVWWPLDEDWYGGVVTAFDSLRVLHTVCYEDGDIEFLRLWAPDQTVRIVSSPSEWAVEAAKTAQKAQQHQAIALDKIAKLTVPSPKQPKLQPGSSNNDSAGADDSSGGSETEKVPLYERRRQANIRRNRKVMKQIMEGGTACEPSAAGRETEAVPTADNSIPLTISGPKYTTQTAPPVLEESPSANLSPTEHFEEIPGLEQAVWQGPILAGSQQAQDGNKKRLAEEQVEGSSHSSTGLSWGATKCRSPRAIPHQL